MITFQIVEINNPAQYVLQEKNGKIYTLDLLFYCKDQPKVGDMIQLHEKLFDKNFSEFSYQYCFGDLEDETGRREPSDEEFTCLRTNGQAILLKRLFG